MDKKIKELDEKYSIRGTKLFWVRNRNELRVIQEMERVLAEYPDFDPAVLDLEDIYALSLNKLPARYTQRGSIVLQEPVRDEEIADAIRDAVEVVRARPNYPL